MPYSAIDRASTSTCSENPARGHSTGHGPAPATRTGQLGRGGHDGTPLVCVARPGGGPIPAPSHAAQGRATMGGVGPPIDQPRPSAGKLNSEGRPLSGSLELVEGALSRHVDGRAVAEVVENLDQALGVLVGTPARRMSRIEIALVMVR